MFLAFYAVGSAIIFPVNVVPLWPVLCLVFADLLGFGMIVVDLQFRAKDLGASPTTIGVLLATTFIVQAICSTFWGRLSDRRGRKPVILLCTMMSALAMLIYGFADSLPFLFASRIISGLGFANVAVAQAMISNASEESLRLKAMGQISATISTGLILGAPMGGFLSKFGGSQAVGFTACAFSTLGAVVVWRFLPDIKAAGSPMAATVRKRFNLGLLQEFPGLWTLVLAVIFAWFCLSLLEGTFGQMIQARLGYGPEEFGVIFGFESLLSILVQTFAMTWLSGRIAERFLLPLSFLAQGIGIALFPIAGGMATLFLASAIYAPGSAVSQPALNSLCSKLIPSERHGELFALLQSARSVGFVVGPIIGGLLLKEHVQLPYFVAAFGCLVAAGLLIGGLNRVGRDQPTLSSP